MENFDSFSFPHETLEKNSRRLLISHPHRRKLSKPPLEFPMAFQSVPNYCTFRPGPLVMILCKAGPLQKKRFCMQLQKPPGCFPGNDWIQDWIQESRSNSCQRLGFRSIFWSIFLGGLMWLNGFQSFSLLSDVWMDSRRLRTVRRTATKTHQTQTKTLLKGHAPRYSNSM